jgi:hypothetical protein
MHGTAVFANAGKISLVSSTKSLRIDSWGFQLIAAAISLNNEDLHHTSHNSLGSLYT